MRYHLRGCVIYGGGNGHTLARRTPFIRPASEWGHPPFIRAMKIPNVEQNREVRYFEHLVKLHGPRTVIGAY